MSDQPDNLTLKTRWVMWRNRILGSAGFQRWASRTPIFRSVARRRAAAQFDLVAGFVYSQILSAFVETGLIGYLNSALRTLSDVATQTRLSLAATERLLLAGASLQIAESPQGGLWTLGEAGAALSANPGAMAMIRHHHLLYRDLADPLAMLAMDRTEETRLSAYWTYAAKGDGQDASGYSGLMAATQPMVSQQVIDAYDFGAHRKMLDVGGGSGAFATAVASAAPNLQLGIFDLPDVIAESQKRLANFPNRNRIAFHPGSFKDDMLPSDYDLITLVRILHDHDDDVVQALLSAIYRALPSGGTLLIAEPMAGSPQAKPMGNAYFGLYLWAMGSGRPRTAGDYAKMLQTAGFIRIKSITTALPIITSALVAIK